MAEWPTGHWLGLVLFLRFAVPRWRRFFVGSTLAWLLTWVCGLVLMCFAILSRTALVLQCCCLVRFSPIDAEKEMSREEMPRESDVQGKMSRERDVKGQRCQEKERERDVRRKRWHEKKWETNVKRTCCWGKRVPKRKRSGTHPVFFLKLHRSWFSERSAPACLFTVVAETYWETKNVALYRVNPSL